MCKSKMATNAIEPSSNTRASRTPRTQPTQSQSPRTSRSDPVAQITTTSDPSTSNTNSAHYTTTTTSSSSKRSAETSITSLRDSLPENPHIYSFTELCSATNNFLAKTYTSTSSTRSWRCTLRGKNAIVFQRKFRRKIETQQLRQRLSVICRSHHMSIIKLLGASVSGDHIYLVYDFVEGSNLANCLRNPKNPNFTVLATWISRMQIATDLAHGLDYIHNNTGLNLSSLVHNHIKSSSIIVTEPSFNAKICHFGTAQLCGEIDDETEPKKDTDSEIQEISETTSSSKSKLKRLDSRKKQFEGVRGYMAPEFQVSGIVTQKCDVYAFGVVILELLSGEEPLKYKYDKTKGDFVKTSVIETAIATIDDDISGRLRKWVDRRLSDSFPVDVAEKLIRLAIDCVHVEPDKRPNMTRVAGKISKLYLESRIWSDNVRMPSGISVSLAPR
jgi:serine/threonine protein kinase